MYRRILVPTDGSDAAETAGEIALSLARRFDAEVHAIHVVEGGDLPADGELPEDVVRQGRRATERIETLAGDSQTAVTTETLVTDSPVHERILAYADEHEVDLIAMGTNGRTGIDRLLLGSVAERTVRLGELPVLTVSDEYVVPDDFEPILCPTDGSDGAWAGLEHGVAFADATGATLHVVHAVDHTALGGAEDAGVVLDSLERRGRRAVDEAVAYADEAGLHSVEATLTSGRAARAIVDYVEERDVQLVVMGTRGRTGLDRYVVGSVTETVVRLCPVPVLTVPTPASTDE